MIPIRFKNWYDDAFEMGMAKVSGAISTFLGDIFWFLDSIMRIHSANWIAFTVVVSLEAFAIFEITGQIAILSFHPSIHDVLQFAPMFFISLHICFASVPSIIQRYSYLELYKNYKKMLPLTLADKKALKQIRAIFLKGIISVSYYGIMNLFGGFGYFPFGGVDYHKTVFPVVGSARLVENGPAYVRHLLILLNFAVIFPKGYFLSFYGLHLMHICTLYTLQNVLLRMKLRNITHDHLNTDPCLLIDNKEYQKYVRQELIKCIEQDVKLKLFCKDVRKYFKWVLLIHTGSCVTLLTILLYINVFLGGGFNPTSSRIILVSGSLTAFLYVYSSEGFTEQVDLTRNAVFETPWHTFDLKNRKMVAIFLTNLVQERCIYAGGMYKVDYSLLIWVFHKVFSLFTVVSQMAMTSVQPK